MDLVPKIAMYRTFLAPDGRELRVSLAPREAHWGGIEIGRLSIIFQTIDGGWVGSAPLIAGYDLDGLTHGELIILYDRASS